jgi:hypothetical protein
MTHENRVFSEQELREMEPLTLDSIIEAIDAGEKEKAKELTRRMYKESLSIHDSYVNVQAATHSYIYKTFGSEGLEKALRDTFKPIAEAAHRASADADIRTRVKTMVHVLRGHLRPLKLEEDDEKICITMQPCGSGQMLVEGGAYGPPRNYAMLNEPHPLTFGMADFPVYCCHDPILEILAMELSGYPRVVCYPPDKMGTAPCRFCIYKDPNNIPEEVYTRVGKEKSETSI